MELLRDLPNIGKELEKQLIVSGIETKDELMKTGSTRAWLKIQEKDKSACLNRLMALEGAIKGIRWHDLDLKTKERLREFYQKNKK